MAKLRYNKFKKMTLIENGGLGLAPNCLVLHGAIPSSIIRSSAIFVKSYVYTITIFVYVSKLGLY